MAQGSLRLGPSLPPRVQGPALGEIEVSVTTKAGRVTLQWWGDGRVIRFDRNHPTCIYPIRADQHSLASYLRDMRTLRFDMLEPRRGKIKVPMVWKIAKTPENVLADDKYAAIDYRGREAGPKIRIRVSCRMGKHSRFVQALPPASKLAKTPPRFYTAKKQETKEEEEEPPPDEEEEPSREAVVDEENPWRVDTEALARLQRQATALASELNDDGELEILAEEDDAIVDQMLLSEEFEEKREPLPKRFLVLNIQDVVGIEGGVAKFRWSLPGTPLSPPSLDGRYSGKTWANLDNEEEQQKAQVIEVWRGKELAALCRLPQLSTDGSIACDERLRLVDPRSSKTVGSLRATVLKGTPAEIDESEKYIADDIEAPTDAPPPAPHTDPPSPPVEEKTTPREPHQFVVELQVAGTCERGCFVKYELSDGSEHSLWWDSESSLFNSRARHLLMTQDTPEYALFRDRDAITFFADDVAYQLHRKDWRVGARYQTITLEGGDQTMSLAVFFDDSKHQDEGRVSVAENTKRSELTPSPPLEMTGPLPPRRDVEPATQKKRSRLLRVRVDRVRGLGDLLRSWRDEEATKGVALWAELAVAVLFDDDEQNKECFRSQRFRVEDEEMMDVLDATLPTARRPSCLELSIALLQATAGDASARVDGPLGLTIAKTKITLRPQDSVVRGWWPLVAENHPQSFFGAPSYVHVDADWGDDYSANTVPLSRPAKEEPPVLPAGELDEDAAVVDETPSVVASEDDDEEEDEPPKTIVVTPKQWSAVASTEESYVTVSVAGGDGLHVPPFRERPAGGWRFVVEWNVAEEYRAEEDPAVGQRDDRGTYSARWTKKISTIRLRSTSAVTFKVSSLDENDDKQSAGVAVVDLGLLACGLAKLDGTYRLADDFCRDRGTLSVEIRRCVEKPTTDMILPSIEAIVPSSRVYHRPAPEAFEGVVAKRAIELDDEDIGLEALPGMIECLETLRRRLRGLDAEKGDHTAATTPDASLQDREQEEALKKEEEEKAVAQAEIAKEEARSKAAAEEASRAAAAEEIARAVAAEEARAAAEQVARAAAAEEAKVRAEEAAAAAQAAAVEEAAAAAQAAAVEEARCVAEKVAAEAVEEAKRLAKVAADELRLELRQATEAAALAERRREAEIAAAATREAQRIFENELLARVLDGMREAADASNDAVRHAALANRCAADAREKISRSHTSTADSVRVIEESTSPSVAPVTSRENKPRHLTPEVAFAAAETARIARIMRGALDYSAPPTTHQMLSTRSAARTSALLSSVSTPRTY